MARNEDFQSLMELLDTIEERARGDGEVSLDTIQDMAGENAFGPVILVPGLLAVSPLTGIPTIPSIIGLLVALISIQLVVGRRKLWLPRRMSGAALNRSRVEKAISFLRPIARWVDKGVGPRLSFATEEWAVRGAALICFLVAITMPPLEIVPFLATTAGLVISLFGLAITLRDGVLMIFGLIVFFGLIGGGVYFWLF
ncbi:exopolysaccharide biosynthesis protein [Aureimonas populi]|uniref:Exopolysaccharide biosynthesis protein n=1 Tax=Aureimonas populi TaxID=1701758 RepID=A0ABW5CN99_9HYPH|nr:exopolysaccharide biosynthesis protein [Aureimonas populi]